MTRQYLINVALVFVSILLCAIAVELGLRFIYPIYESAARSDYERDHLRIWAPRANRRSTLPHPDTGVPHFVIQNELALRQSRNFDDLATATNIAFFGDSYTANNGLPAPYSFTEPLDYLLNQSHRRFNVLNFGVNGYGTDQEYLYYSDVAKRIPLRKVFYVLCANDLRNIFETRLFSVNERGELVRNPVPKPAWWITPISRLHITYLALDLRQRLLYSRKGNLDDYRATMERRAALQAYRKRFDDEEADDLQRGLLENGDNADLAKTILLFRRIMNRWRDAVESNGAEFHVVLLPTGREEIFRSFLGPEFHVISLRNLFTNSMGSFEWHAVQFKSEGHWAEEGNRLAALHLYREIETDMKLPSIAAIELERLLAVYYSSFPYGWMPDNAPTTSTISPNELARIREKYAALELNQ